MKKRFFALLIAVAMLLTAIPFAMADAEPTLKVGASRILLEPTAEVMATQKNFDGNPVTGIYNDQYARAIVIDNGEQLALLLVLESGSSDRDDMRAAIEAATGIPASNMLITDIHNHTSIGGKEFSAYALEQAIVAVKEAMANMVPAKYGFGTTNSYINMNRDKQQEDGYWMQDVNPEGYSDKTLAIIKFVDMNDNLIATFMNYPMHAMAGFNQPDVDGQYKVSSNVPGVTCAYMEDRFPGAVCVWSSGAAGNQNPLEIGSPTYYTDPDYPEMVNLPDGASFALMELYGQRQAFDAIKCLAEINADKTKMPMAFIRTEVALPAQKAPAGADMSYNRLVADNLVRKVLGVENPPPRETVVMEDDPDNPVIMKQSMIVLGDICLVGIPAEIYCQIGRDIKEASLFKNTVVVQFTDDGCGYILDKSSAGTDVFQSFSRVKPGAADELIVNGVLEMQAEFFGTK